VSRLDRLFAGYCFDLDGTLYLGDALLPGAAEVVQSIRDGGARVVFVTNKPLFTAADYAAKLTDLGIPAAATDLVTALDSTLLYLASHHAGATVLPVAEPLVSRVLMENGFHVTTDPAAADVVLASFDRTFDYAKLDAAYRAIKLAGAVLIGTNPDVYCPTPEGGIPDCGAMLAAIEACTGATAEAVLGKPSRYMADAALERLGVPAGDAVLVGDRLATDITMAKSAGMSAVLVLTGDSSAEAARSAEVKPDFVIDNLFELLPVAGPS
jgi:HAD superfamily hydrolase (TIGR01450 family)